MTHLIPLLWVIICSSAWDTLLFTCLFYIRNAFFKSYLSIPFSCLLFSDSSPLTLIVKSCSQWFMLLPLFWVQCHCQFHMKPTQCNQSFRFNPSKHPLFSYLWKLGARDWIHGKNECQEWLFLCRLEFHEQYYRI